MKTLLRAAVAAAALAMSAPAMAVDVAYAQDHDEQDIIDSVDAAKTAVQVGEKTYYTGFIPRPHGLAGSRYISFSKAEIKALPASWDERTDRGCVTAIRNQGNCGSCWAFSRTASLEAAKCLAGLAPMPNQTNLSEQDTVGNDKSAYGCSGGFMGFDYETDHGIGLESACPYTASNKKCSVPVDTKGMSWTFIGDSQRGPTPDDLKAAIVKYGVVSVTSAAGGSGYDTGSDGIFKGCGAKGINHMVNLVGYKTIGSTLYFLMRNSWGTSWGTDGYGWMPFGCNQTGSGQESAAVVVVDGPGPVPAIKLAGAPLEVVTLENVEYPLSVKPEAGVSYSWSYGNVQKSGERIWLKGVVGPVTLTGTKDGAKVQTIINITAQ